MSIIKNSDTNLLSSEKKTLKRFFAIYIFLCTLIFLLLGFGYFRTQKNAMLQEEKTILNHYANEQIKLLKKLHVNIDKSHEYPKNSHYRSGIFDANRTAIYSNLTERPNFKLFLYTKHGNIFYVKELESYYVGAKYLILEIPDEKKWLLHSYMVLAWVGLPLLVLFLLVGFMLFKLFLSPMKDAINLLDRFIKDTTHELNTPISTILLNLESLDMEKFSPREQKKLRRIELAAGVVSNLYRDLAFISLEHRLPEKIENLDIVAMLEERLEYFSIGLGDKNIHLYKQLLPCRLRADRAKILRLIDNLISNAIKYNHQNGYLKISCKENFMEFTNDGEVIHADKLQKIFNRYERDSDCVGGFGIGLHLVSLIAKEYKISIQISSNEKEGTCIKLSW